MVVFAACRTADADDTSRTLVYQFTLLDRGQSASTDGRVTAVIQEQDGIRTIDVTEVVDRAARPEEAFTCTLKADVDNIECSDKMAGTDESLTMVQFLNPAFYAPSRLDANDRWHAEMLFQDATIKGDFTVTGRRGDLVTIAAHDEERSTKYAFYRGWETGTLVYDTVARVPQSIDLQTATVLGRNEGETRLTLDLISDSTSSRPKAAPLP